MATQYGTAEFHRRPDAALMEAYAVNRAVNSVKNDTEECIEPVPPDHQTH